MKFKKQINTRRIVWNQWTGTLTGVTTDLTLAATFLPTGIINCITTIFHVHKQCWFSNS